MNFQEENDGYGDRTIQGDKDVKGKIVESEETTEDNEEEQNHRGDNIDWNLLRSDLSSSTLELLKSHINNTKTGS